MSEKEKDLQAVTAEENDRTEKHESSAGRRWDLSSHLLRLIDLTAAGHDIRQIRVTNLRERDGQRWTPAEMELIGKTVDPPLLQIVQSCLSEDLFCNYVVTDDHLFFLFAADAGSAEAKLLDLQEKLQEAAPCHCVYQIMGSYERGEDVLKFIEKKIESSVSEEETPQSRKERSQRPKAAELEKMLVSSDREKLEEYLGQILLQDASEIGALQILTTVNGVFYRLLEKGSVNTLLRKHHLRDLLSETGRKRQVLQEINDYCLEGYEKLNSRKRSDIEEVVAEVNDLIEERYSDPEFTLQRVSEIFHLSPNYLSAQFSRCSGSSFRELLKKKRMETALEMLQGGEIRIADVAEHCGFSDPQHFSTSFHRYYGFSPVEYRTGQRKKK